MDFWVKGAKKAILGLGIAISLAKKSCILLTFRQLQKKRVTDPIHYNKDSDHIVYDVSGA